MASARAVHGLIAIHKPKGVRSRQVCNLIQSLLKSESPNAASRHRRPRFKVGHGGTLDPMATGVLVIGIGNGKCCGHVLYVGDSLYYLVSIAYTFRFVTNSYCVTGTKKLQGYLNGPKEYTATMLLGQQTDTGDCDTNSTVILESPWSHITKDQVYDAVSSFQGNRTQIPPIYSAIKQNGVKAYEKARQGITQADMKLSARPITIHNIAVTDVDQLPYISFKCTVSKGTYIRVLVEDIAKKLGTVGHMTALERTRQGTFSTDDCIAYPPVSLDDVCNSRKFIHLPGAAP
eukprot:m.391797 g.391797  ORF g.391797 m.391797 type:complete len:289 (-) comp21076_c1_seq2:102-968(-)